MSFGDTLNSTTPLSANTDEHGLFVEHGSGLVTRVMTSANNVPAGVPSVLPPRTPSSLLITRYIGDRPERETSPHPRLVATTAIAVNPLKQRMRVMFTSALDDPRRDEDEKL